jgi:hypothetical protein
MLPAVIAYSVEPNAFVSIFRRLPGKTAILLKGSFVLFFQEAGDLSTALLQVTVQISSDSECKSTYADYWDLTDRMMCAGDPNGGKGACWVTGL